MRIKIFLIAALIIGAMTFPFMHNVMPVVAHSASPAASTATAAAAQGINPQASYGVQIMDFNPFSLLFGQNVLPGATHSAFPATSTATAAAPDYPSDGSNPDHRIWDGSVHYSLLSQGPAGSQVIMYYDTKYCDEAWQLVNTNPSNPQGPYQIRHSNNGTCVGVPSDGNGVIAVQTACNSQSPKQLWYREPAQGFSNFIVFFRNAGTQKYLCHAGLAPVKQYSFSGYANSPGTYIWFIAEWDGCQTSSGKCIAPSLCPY